MLTNNHDDNVEGTSRRYYEMAVAPSTQEDLRIRNSELDAIKRDILSKYSEDVETAESIF